jgi:hypothetical protein
VLDIWQGPSDGDLVELMATGSAGHVAGFSDGDPGGEEDPVPYLDQTRNVANMPMIGRERLVPGDRLLWHGTPTRTGWASNVLVEADAYCQVVCRTWQTKIVELGTLSFPRLFNHPDLDAVPAHLHQRWAAAVMAAMKLPGPRSWAPRDPDKEDGWAPIADNPQDPEYWLPQLSGRPREAHKARDAKTRKWIEP